MDEYGLSLCYLCNHNYILSLTERMFLMQSGGKDVLQTYKGGNYRGWSHIQRLCGWTSTSLQQSAISQIPARSHLHIPCTLCTHGSPRPLWIEPVCIDYSNCLLKAKYFTNTVATMFTHARHVVQGWWLLAFKEVRDNFLVPWTCWFLCIFWMEIISGFNICCQKGTLPGLFCQKHVFFEQYFYTSRMGMLFFC